MFVLCLIKLIILLLKVFWNNIIIDLLEKIWKKKEVVFELMVISKYGSPDDENMLKLYLQDVKID